jgi:hypothetical protein
LVSSICEGEKSEQRYLLADQDRLGRALRSRRKKEHFKHSFKEQPQHPKMPRTKKLVVTKHSDSSEEEDNREEGSSSDDDKAPYKSRLDLIRTYFDIESFGAYGETHFTTAVEHLKDQGAWSMTEYPETDPNSPEQKIEQAFTSPPCFRNTKIKSLKAFIDNNADKHEKPLFEQAVALKDSLLVITLARQALLRGDAELTAEVLYHLENKLIRDLKRTNYKRLVSRFPDRDTRTLLKQPSHHGAKDTEMMKLVNNTLDLQRKIAKARTKASSSSMKKKDQQDQFQQRQPYKRPQHRPSEQKPPARDPKPLAKEKTPTKGKTGRPRRGSVTNTSITNE